MDADLQINEKVTIPAGELWFVASRAGGPGGQHVNKTNSRVSLHWNLLSSAALSEAQKTRVRTVLSSRISSEGVLSVHVDENRSQHRNRETAMERLAEMIAKALIVPKKRKRTKVSKAAQRRRLDAKKRRAESKKMRQKPSAE